MRSVNVAMNDITIDNIGIGVSDVDRSLTIYNTRLETPADSTISASPSTTSTQPTSG